MPRPRFERLDEAKRTLILETSAREFANHGYDGASLNRILTEAGISKGAAYYYFDDKADLFATVVDHYWTQVYDPNELKPETLHRDDFWPRIHDLHARALTRVYRRPWMMPLFRNLLRPENTPHLPPTVLEAMSDVRDLATALLHRGQELGVVRDDLPLDLLSTLMLGADELADRWIGEHCETLGEAETKRIMAVWLKTLQRLLSPAQEDAP